MAKPLVYRLSDLSAAQNLILTDAWSQVIDVSTKIVGGFSMRPDCEFAPSCALKKPATASFHAKKSLKYLLRERNAGAELVSLYKSS